VKKIPLEPITVTLSEAFRLLSVSRSRFYQWQKAGLVSPYRFNGNRPLYLRAAVLALLDDLPHGPKSAGPLLPPEDRALARDRASPDFSRVFAERLKDLVPSLGEADARTRALAYTIRAYRRDQDCSFDTARAAVLVLIEPPSSEPDGWERE